jgi:hypothetical protein
MHMVMFVLNNPDLLDELLDAWRALGVSGVTLLESSGSYRRRAYLLGTRFVHESSLLTQSIEEGHFTLFAVVPDEAAVQQCLAVTETIVGDLDQPETGIFTSWALGLTKGVPPTLQPNTHNWGEDPA